MHAGVAEAVERRVRIVGVVQHTRDDHRRGAVLQEVHLAGQARVDGQDVGQQVVDGPGHAVALGLAGDDQHVVGQQLLDEQRVALCPGQRLAVEGGQHLRPQDRVVLGPGVGALDLVVGLHPARDGVEEAGLLETADEGVPLAPDETVERPDRELVAPPLLELLGVVLEVALGRHQLDVQGRGHERARPPDAVDDVLVADQDERVGVLAGVVHEERRVEHRERAVRVQGVVDAGDAVQVAVDELHQPHAVIDATGARTTADEQLAQHVAEGVLHVDVEQADPDGVLDGRLQAVLVAPVDGSSHETAVVEPAIRVHDQLLVVVRRKDELVGHDAVTSIGSGWYCMGFGLVDENYWILSNVISLAVTT